MFGINGGELLVLLLVAVVVVGPERLPRYAEQLGRWVRVLRRQVSGMRERLSTELGEEAADVDWAALDPRQYDPRRIVREALFDDPAAPGPASRGPAGRPTAAGGAALPAGAAAPFDDEAT